MSASKRLQGAIWRLPKAQSGTTALEVALLAPIFFMLVFGVIEVARLLYVYNTLQEVTRRAAAAAANVDPRDASAISKIKQNAVFRDSPGTLVLGAPVTDAHVRIEYFSLGRAPDGSTSLVSIPESSLPSCPGANRSICMSNPNAAGPTASDSNGPYCVRFVSVSVCDPADTAACDAVPSTLAIPTVNFSVKLPRSTTIVPAESLGFMPGMTPSP